MAEIGAPVSTRKEELVSRLLVDIESDLRKEVQRAVGQIPRLARFADRRASELDSVLSALDTFLAAEAQGGEEADAALERLKAAWGAK